MLFFNRFFRCSLLCLLGLMVCLLGMIPGVCAAQGDPVQNVAKVQPTTADRVTGIATSSASSPLSGTTIALYLCVGPTTLCPSNGYVLPPFLSNQTMVYGQTYNGTAVVTPIDGSAVGGSSLFYDSVDGGPNQLLCTLAIASGGTCPPSVGSDAHAGTHVFTAAYTGDATHATSVSAPVTIVVGQDGTMASVVGTPDVSPAGQPVIFTATLAGHTAPQAGNSGSIGSYLSPAGPVVFLYGGAILGTIDLVRNATGVSSTATLSTSALPVGTDVVTASYAASLDFAGAIATSSETIAPALAGNFAIVVTPTPLSVAAGYSTLLTVVVTPQKGFSRDVNLTCANLPRETTCFFDTSTLAGGGGTTNLVVATTAPHSCATTQAYLGGADGGGSGTVPVALPALGALLAMLLPGRRRWLRTMVGLAVAVTAMQMTGCGNSCIGLGTRPATYTFQVTASSAGTTEVESQPVTITVTN